jgi:hypothetical protein
MLRTIDEITGYVLRARDGEIGRCKDFLFDEEHWTIRYMVADTGRWLPKRKVLISPISLDEPIWAEQVLPVRLTKEQVENAPALDDDAPVSRQHEIMFHTYYGWPYYWGMADVWGEGAYPRPLYVEKKEEQKKGEKKRQEPTDDADPHLRSVKEVTGYHIQATDGEIGHVEGFIIDDETWEIRYMIVDTRNWLPGRKVLVSPTWITSLSWSDRKVIVDLSREVIKESPKFDPSAPVNREYEERLYDYYGRPRYWLRDPSTVNK